MGRQFVPSICDFFLPVGNLQIFLRRLARLVLGYWMEGRRLGGIAQKGEVPGVSCQHDPLTTATVFLRIRPSSGEAELNEGSKQGDYIDE